MFELGEFAKVSRKFDAAVRVITAAVTAAALESGIHIAVTALSQVYATSAGVYAKALPPDAAEKYLKVMEAALKEAGVSAALALARTAQEGAKAYEQI